MKCPYCKEDDSKVIDSRPIEENYAIRRRRECTSCQNRFTTYERIEEMEIIVVKKQERREAFDKNKITSGIIRACYKRDVPIEKINAIADEILQDVKNRSEREVTSEYIGQRVMEALKDLDEVAYVRFASVYKSFQDVESFTEVVRGYKDEKK